ncbi:MAG: hypothetical protein ACTSP1_13940 [Candidatus Freyarchaeota archaeon]
MRTSDAFMEQRHIERRGQNQLDVLALVQKTIRLAEEVNRYCGGSPTK